MLTPPAVLATVCLGVAVSGSAADESVARVARRRHPAGGVSPQRGRSAGPRRPQAYEIADQVPPPSVLDQPPPVPRSRSASGRRSPRRGVTRRRDGGGGGGRRRGGRGGSGGSSGG